jgi:hypothetical protein
MSIEIAKTNRRWFRFSLRVLLIVVAVVGCWLGWQANLVHRRKVALSELRPRAVFLSSVVAEREKSSGDRLVIPWDHVREIPFWRRLMGDESIGWIYLEDSASPADLELAKSLFPEAHVESNPAASLR